MPVARELEEESGVRGRPAPLLLASVEWAVVEMVVPWGTHIVVDGVEQDRYEWLTLEEACARCLPPIGGESLRLAAR